MSVERIKQLLTELDTEAISGARFHFQGLRLSEDDLYAARHRAYSPLPGRWLQDDPGGYVEGENRYTFINAPHGDDH